MKRSFTPTVTTMEDRMALSTTIPTIVVQPPTVTGTITTYEYTDVIGPMEWFTPICPNSVDGKPEPVIIPLPSGTDEVNHFVALTTTEFVQAPKTVPIALATSPLTFTPVSQFA